MPLMPQKKCYNHHFLFSLLLFLLPYTAMSCRPRFIPISNVGPFHISFEATPTSLQVIPSSTESSVSIPGWNYNPNSMQKAPLFKSCSVESSEPSWGDNANPNSLEKASRKSSLVESFGSILGGNANANSVEKGRSMTDSFTKYFRSNPDVNPHPDSMEMVIMTLIKSSLAAPSGPNPGGNANPNTKT